MTPDAILALQDELKELRETLQLQELDGAPNPTKPPPHLPIKLSTAMLIRAIKSTTGKSLPIKNTALDNFIEGTIKKMNVEVIEILSDFIYGTQLGRSLRRTADSRLTPHDILIDAMATRSSNYDIIGNYLVYHGSYKTPKHFAIRAMRVFADNNGIISIEDHVGDSRTSAGNSKRIRTSTGNILFVNDHPHLLFKSNDNRIGLCLLVGGELVTKGKTVVEFSGNMMGMSSDNKPFYRKTLAVRRSEDIAALKDLSGVFSKSDLSEMAENHKGKYKPALHYFTRLNHVYLDELFTDPVREL